jgi:ABC-type dipeptide/oligopeptide/nickel transport system ATPase component
MAGPPPTASIAAGRRAPPALDTLVQIDGLTIAFPDDDDRPTPVVHDVSFTIVRDEILGLVGESGSGKTQTALAIPGLTRPPGQVVGGRVLIDGEDVVRMDEVERRRVRGDKVAMIFQSPRTALNPLMTVGDQLDRVYARHRGLGRRAARAEALSMLRKVGIAGPARVAAAYPHQLSGGMAQRVMIGMMVACGPELLIADEPTTGLDVTIQAQIFELIEEVQAETRMSVLLITHDLGVVAETCQRVAVMQAGRLVEMAPVEDLFARPRHPYTVRLLGAILRPDLPPTPATERPVAPEALSLVVGGRRYRAVSVDAWATIGAGAAEPVEVEPGHLVLCHAEAPAPETAAEAQG